MHFDHGVGIFWIVDQDKEIIRLAAIFRRARFVEIGQVARRIAVENELDIFDNAQHLKGQTLVPSARAMPGAVTGNGLPGFRL